MSEWKKVKIGEIFKIEKGSLQSSKCIPGKYDFITAATDWKTHESYSHDCEAIVYAVAASGSLGRAHYVKGKFIASDLCFILTEKNKEKYPINFLFYQLVFEVLRDEIVSKTKTGTSKESINQKNFSNYEIPYIPYDYQMNNYKKLVDTKKTVIKILKEIESQKVYAKQLRQNILQEAIEGKLTEDLPCRQAGWRKNSFRNLSGKLVPKESDKYFAYVLECNNGSLYKGYTRNLFERINRHLEERGAEWTAKHTPVSLIHFEEFNKEKEALEREKYFKSGSGREYINEIRNHNKLEYDAEALFEKIQEEKLKNENGKGKTQNPLFYENLDIPKNWLFPLLNEITKQITDGTHLTPNYVTQGEVFLSAQNIKPFCFIPKNHRFVSKNDFEKYRNNRTPEKNDILMARVGAGIGEAAVIDTNLEFAFYVSLCLIKTFSNFMNPNYLAIVLNSSYGVRYAKNNISSSGTSAGNYNLGHIRALKIPLPPLAEQKEIVSRVEKLLANVTELEKQITEREEMTKQLMQSIMKDAFREV